MKLARCFFGVVTACYAVQVGFALYFEVIPIEQRQHNGDTYVVRQGYRLHVSLIPLIGAAGFSDEVAVRLDVYGQDGTRKFARGFDMKIDVEEAYPDVWPKRKRG